MISQEEILKWLKLGGVTLGSILILSIVAVALTIERLWTFRGFMVHLRRVKAAVQKAVQEAKEPREAARKAIPESTVAPLAEVFLASTKGNPEKIEASVDRARQRAGLYLKRGMWILGTIGATTPFIGLFGTVSGIIKAMGKIGETGQTGFTVVAAGISEALITTAAGIAVAIEAVILFNALQNRLSTITLELRLNVEEFVESLRIKLDQQSSAAPEPVKFEKTEVIEKSEKADKKSKSKKSEESDA